MVKKFKTVEKTNGYKTPIHAIKQELGITKNSPLAIFDDIENRDLVRQAENENVKIVGWDLNFWQDRVVAAITKIYTKNRYQNNFRNGIVFIPTDFYKACELEKHNYKGNMIYSPREIRRAQDSLMSLHGKNTMMTYTRKDTETGKYDRIEIYSMIIKEIDFLYHELNEPNPTRRKKNEKLKYIYVEPSRVLIDQIENYFAIMPDRLYTEMKSLEIKDKYFPLFIKWLAMTKSLQKGSKKTGIVTEIGLDKLAVILRMDAWIKGNRKKMIRDSLIRIFERSQALKYLNDYKILPSKEEGEKVRLSIKVRKDKIPVKIKRLTATRFVFNNEENMCQEISINAPLPEGYKEED